MAIYGLRTYNSAGALTLATDKNYSRLLYAGVHNMSSNGSINLPALTGKTSIQWAENLANESGPSVWRSGTTIYWGKWVSAYTNYPIGSCILIVMVYT